MCLRADWHDRVCHAGFRAAKGMEDEDGEEIEILFRVLQADCRGGRDGRGGMGEIPGGDARADPIFPAREADPPDSHGFVCTAGGHVDPGELVYPGTGGIGALSAVFCVADTVYPPLLHIGERGAAVV